MTVEEERLAPSRSHSSQSMSSQVSGALTCSVNQRESDESVSESQSHSECQAKRSGTSTGKSAIEVGGRDAGHVSFFLLPGAFFSP